jgi:leader peptidase (prepilin peptidase)/N-methyltransferase
VVSPPSRCPVCGAGIRWYFNLPVLGWLLLRGRCYDCQSPIAARYPTVEFFVGSLFLLLAMQAVLPGGPWWLLNVPPRELLGVGWPQLALAFVYYQTLNVTLIAAAYIAWDQQRVPGKLWLPAWLLGLSVPLVWNELRPTGISPTMLSATLWQGAWQGALGAVAGLCCGLMFDAARNLKNASGEPRGRTLIPLATCGLMLGWQAALLIAGGGALVGLVGLLLANRRWSAACAAPLAGVALATIGLTLAGRVVFERSAGLLSGGVLAILVWCLVTAALLAVSALLQRALYPPPDIEPTTVESVPLSETDSPDSTHSLKDSP